MTAEVSHEDYRGSQDDAVTEKRSDSAFDVLQFGLNLAAVVTDILKDGIGSHGTDLGHFDLLGQLPVTLFDSDNLVL